MNWEKEFERWLKENPNATLKDAFRAGWMKCSNAWCHGKREQMETCIELMKQIID